MAPQGAGHAAFMTSCEFSKTREEDTRQGEVTPLAELWAPRNRASKVETALPGPRGLGLLRSKRTAGEAGQAHTSLLPRGDVLLHQSWGNRKIGGKTQHGACERKPRLSSRNTIPKSQKKTFSLKRTCLQTLSKMGGKFCWHPREDVGTKRGLKGSSQGKSGIKIVGVGVGVGDGEWAAEKAHVRKESGTFRDARETP